MPTEVASRNENGGNRLCRIPNRLKKGHAAWFINSANSSSPFGFPRTAQSCAPHDRDGFCNLRDRRGAGRPQCLEPAVLRGYCREKFSGVLGPTASFRSHFWLPSRPERGASLASRNDQA